MNYLVAGFTAVWLLVTVYLVFMGQRQGKLEQELQSLEELVRARDKGKKRA